MYKIIMTAYYNNQAELNKEACTLEAAFKDWKKAALFAYEAPHILNASIVNVETKEVVYEIDKGYKEAFEQFLEVCRENTHVG